MQRFLAVLVGAVTVWSLIPASPAQACSCATLDPAQMLEESDAAFVGTLVEAPTEPLEADGFEGIWVFEVEEWIKGDLGPQVGIHAALDGAACGFEMEVGTTTGIFVHNNEGRPSGGLCSTTTAAAMRSAGEPLAFDGSGPAVFLIASHTGRTRLATLDASGRLLAALGGNSSQWSVSVCPEGRNIVELTEDGVSVYDSATLEESGAVTSPDDESVEQLWCIDPEGMRILAGTTQGADPGLRLLGDDEPIYQGSYAFVAASPSHVAVLQETTNSSVVLMDLESGESKLLLHRVTDGRLAFSPGGDQLLVSETRFDSQGGYAATPTVYAVPSGEVIWREEAVDDTEFTGWLDNHRLLGSRYPVEADTPQLVSVSVPDGTVAEVDLGDGSEFFPIGSGFAYSVGGRLEVVEAGQVTMQTDLPTPNHRLVAVLDPETEPTSPEPSSDQPPSTEAPSTSMPTATEQSSSHRTGWIAPAIAVGAALAALGALVAWRRRESD